MSSSVTPTSSVVVSHGGNQQKPSNLAYIGFVHGVLMLVAFGILFPLGGAVLRALQGKYVARMHAMWQLAAWLLAVVGFGMGVYVSSNGRHGTFTSKNGHKQIGLTVFIIMTLQPIHGILHHLLFRKKQAPTAYGYIHRWIGRGAVLAGSINIGLGLMLGPPSPRRILAYAVVTAVFATIYITVTLLYGPETKNCPTLKKSSTDTTRNNSIDTTSTAKVSQDVEKEGGPQVQTRTL